MNHPGDAGQPDAGQPDGGCDPVATLFAPSCATAACHSAGTQQGKLDLESAGMPQRLVGKKASGGPGLTIDPQHPEQSVLYTKTTATPPFKFQMPLGADPLTAAQLLCLQSWIDKSVGK